MCIYGWRQNIKSLDPFLGSNLFLLQRSSFNPYTLSYAEGQIDRFTGGRRFVCNLITEFPSNRDI